MQTVSIDSHWVAFSLVGATRTPVVHLLYAMLIDAVWSSLIKSINT